jgi:CRISPR system Cascade subunit CasB
MKSVLRSDLPDFAGLWDRYQATTFPAGARAELRRVGEPADLALTTALYRLFPGERPDERHRRVAFLLPWCDGAKGKSPGFAEQMVAKGISEARVLQVARAPSPLDMIYFRRLAMHVEPVVEWANFGPILWFWGDRSKRRIMEDFYLALFKTSKGGKK